MKKTNRSGRQNKIIGQTGEYLAAAELGRRGYIATTFTGNVPEFDILVANKDLKTFPIQVKTIRQGGSFQSDAAKWMDIDIIKGKKQIIRRKTRLANPSLICIMIALGDKYGQDEFFLLNIGQLQKLYFDNHANVLKVFRGKRPRNPESLHTAIRPSDLESYRNNWDILKK